MLSIQEIRQLQTKELHDELARATRELLQSRLDFESGASKESHKLPQLKKHIARLKTIMREQPEKAAAPKEMKTEESAPVKAEAPAKAKVKKAAAPKAKAKAAPAKKTTKATKK